MTHDPHATLGAAIASALRDAAQQWQRENGTGGLLGDDLAQHVETLEFYGELRVGGPMGFAIEVKDRRPGRSHSVAYILERSPQHTAMFRRLP